VEKLNLSLDLRRALALFILLDSSHAGPEAGSPAPDRAGPARDDLDLMEEEIRNYLYNNLSISDMEKPEEFYLSLLKRDL